MSRIEIIFAFKAMKHLVKAGDLAALEDVIDSVLREAQAKTDVAAKDIERYDD